MKTNSSTIPTPLPFGMLHKDSTSISIRGYEPYPETWSYDAKTQVSDLLRMGGPSEPTTTSSVSGTTGIFTTDSDESNDDKGTD
jgi:hypothetical protein